MRAYKLTLPRVVKEIKGMIIQILHIIFLVDEPFMLSKISFKSRLPRCTSLSSYSTFIISNTVGKYNTSFAIYFVFFDQDIAAGDRVLE